VRVWGNVLDLADVPQLQWCIQVANESFLAEEPELIREFLRVAQRIGSPDSASTRLICP
jgi:ABC-type nitrate/sulfonate/bicarbonate transport system substrate-binding protein